MKHRVFSLSSVTAAALVLAGVLVGAMPSSGHGNGNGHKPKTCDPTAVASAAASIAAACPCAAPMGGSPASWKNHGQYVRCVAHATRDAVKSSSLKHKCLDTQVRCAAQSTCGRSGDVVACRQSSAGTCMNAVCSNDAGRTCAVDADCTVASCMIASSAACTATAGTGSCCSASPSGAFVD